MSTNSTEEKSPLLFVLDGNEDISKAEKAYDTNRFRGIAHGATAVFTHFPNFIGTCWIVTALFGLIFFMILLLLLSTIATTGLRVPRCVAAEDAANETVHLVHLHRPGEWNPAEAKLIAEIIKTYPSFKIHLINLREERSLPRLVETTTTSTTGSSITTGNDVLKTLIRRKRKIGEARYNPFSIDMEAKRLIDMLLHGKLDEPRKIRSTPEAVSIETTTVSPQVSPITGIEDISKLYPNIHQENLSFAQAFSSSPLHFYWPHLNEKLRVFAVRVLQLWQFGGISFDLGINNSQVKTFDMLSRSEEMGHLKNNTTQGKRLKSFILSDTLGYAKLPVGVVEVDEEGVHMESKVPCHAFFGEVLMNLRKAASGATVRDVMRKSIKVFCKHFSASRKYCDAFNSE